MNTRKEPITILVVNSAEKGITEFTDPIAAILDEAGITPRVAEYMEIPGIAGSHFQGIILSGSPCGDDIVDHHIPWFRWVKTCDIPVLGFCAGHHVIGKMYGSDLLRSVEIEIGDFYITLDQPEDPLFDGFERRVLVRQNHNDSITLPPGFILLAHSDICKVEAMKHPTKPIYTTQFHPEILNKNMILNFVNIIREPTEHTEGAAPPTQDLHHHSLKQSLPKYSSQKNKNFTDSITENTEKKIPKDEIKG